MANVSTGWLKDFNNNRFMPITHTTKVFNTNGISVETKMSEVDAAIAALQAQNSFKDVKVGTTTISADSAQDTLEIAAGDGITLTASSDSDKLTIAHKDTSSVSSVTASTGTFITALTIDTFGHITATSTGTAATLTIGTVTYNGTGAATVNLDSFGITATAAELNILDGITASTTELNYVKGVTSDIQTQLNNKSVVKIVRWS